MLKKAREFAINAHQNQKYGHLPYLVHLEAVVTILNNYGETAQIIGYLHDVVEDTDISCKDIKNIFGDIVADCVNVLTDESGRNRKERKKKTYKKMSHISHKLKLALIVKAADRLANVQACISGSNNELLNMYKLEHTEFATAVYRQGLCDDIWHMLDKLIKC